MLAILVDGVQPERAVRRTGRGSGLRRGGEDGGESSASSGHEAGDLERQVERLRQIVRGMGEQVAVRLGLSRSFGDEQGVTPAGCWLMADGFFSLSDPQP